jgi:thiol:disulfide interchange protein DsbD
MAVGTHFAVGGHLGALGLLLIIPFIYLGWRKLWKGVGLVAFTYGILLLAGTMTSPQREYLQVLCNTAIACEVPPLPAFEKIRTMQQLQR